VTSSAGVEISFIIGGKIPKEAKEASAELDKPEFVL
jgi:hypothetical protein